MKSRKLQHIRCKTNILRIIPKILFLIILFLLPFDLARADDAVTPLSLGDSDAYTKSMDVLRRDLEIINTNLRTSVSSSVVPSDLIGLSNDATRYPNDALLNPNNASTHPNNALANRNDATVHPNNAANYTNDATLRPNTTSPRSTPRSVNR